MKDHNGSQNDVRKSLVGLVMIFLAIVLSDVTTGTLSVPATTLMAAVIISLSLLALCVPGHSGNTRHY